MIDVSRKLADLTLGDVILLVAVPLLVAIVVQTLGRWRNQIRLIEGEDAQTQIEHEAELRETFRTQGPSALEKYELEFLDRRNEQRSAFGRFGSHRSIWNKLVRHRFLASGLIVIWILIALFVSRNG